MLFVVKVGALGAAALTFLESEPDADSGTPIVPESEFVMATDDLRFVMPAEPDTESLSETVLDREVIGMAWTVDSEDHFVQVLAIDLGEPIDESLAQAGFDSMNGGMARRADGNITSDEIFSDGDVRGRRTVITVVGGRLYATSFASGNWIVSVAGAAEGTRRPVHFDDIVASVEFEQPDESLASPWRAGSTTPGRARHTVGCRRFRRTPPNTPSWPMRRVSSAWIPTTSSAPRAG